MVLTAVGAVLAALIGTAGMSDIIPKQVMAYLILGNAVLAAVLGAVAQSKVTPLSSPRDEDGERLVVLRRRPGA